MSVHPLERMHMAYVSDRGLAERFGVHRSTIWRWVDTNPEFPKPVELSPGCTRWKLEEIEAWEAARTTGLAAK